ncbi:MAG: hypothetical protein CO137_02835 [Candidatus Magasanikbacteria bacterium CG_4_9_14_3_um_filter_32_9]|uniref:Glycosyltransferase 2-like domain-containing protein n=1 Tax=Candidatus Magasanikbacteria bacterium CG_4_9_14_3_um_filter_32_9 TaxID=1974644 RepID=A0A2M7Z6J3_9BACT|nr:MAG: hypothetical protein CO137_02835 [Candidatus Magasanikbacteria bacterium CG_4_9_14_3_um_filter_32_9]
MNHKLSIIIPCYNCSKTLEEAVASVFVQSIEIPFEIVMVDDGSVDDTRDVMTRLSKKYSVVKCLYHEKNKGGGAARNTGIKNCSGDLIFCLDSDNILAPHSMQKMINYLDEKKCDGVVIYERRFFLGNDITKYKAHFNKILDRSLEFADLFNDSDTILDNFLFTKESYLLTGGYPEHHDFDTQCFEVRYLARGYNVFVHPEVTFYHRQAGEKKSYFERVYESGEFSLNFYYILEDALYLFSKEARMAILKYDVFKNSKLGNENIKSMLAVKYAKNINNLFLLNYKKYLRDDGLESYIEDVGDNNSNDEKFVRAVYFYQKQEYKKGSDIFIELLNNGFASKLVYFNIMRCTVALSGVEKVNIEKETIKILGSFELNRQKINLNPGLIKKMMIYFYKLLKVYDKN